MPEESAFSCDSSEEQIPRSARNDNGKEFFNKLLGRAHRPVRPYESFALPARFQTDLLPVAARASRCLLSFSSGARIKGEGVRVVVRRHTPMSDPGPLRQGEITAAEESSRSPAALSEAVARDRPLMTCGSPSVHSCDGDSRKRAGVPGRAWKRALSARFDGISGRGSGRRVAP